MAPTPTSSHFSDRLTSRRGSWLSLAAAAFVFVVLFGLFGSAEAPGGNDPAPAGSESAAVTQLLDEFPDADQETVIVVASRSDAGPLSNADVAALDRMRPQLDDLTGLAASKPRVSDDREAAIITTPVTVGDDNAQTADIIKDLRTVVHEHAPSGLTLQVTGGPAFGADVTSAFDGADFTLLIVTILIVAILLILTYRSPLLWLAPIVVVAVADQVAGKVTAAVGSALDLQFDAGIVTVLVFGAGTNYALLLISRYREELAVQEDHRAALSGAWRKTVPAIFASNVTVVLALLTLTFAVIPGTHGLGITSALGLVLALAAVLFVLPPLLAVCGRRMFWPFVPRPGATTKPGRVWHGIASRVARRPVASLVSGLVLVAVMASGLLSASVGLAQVDQFRGESESATGLEVFGEHFSPGEAQPMFVVADAGHADAVAGTIDDIDGVNRAHVLATTDDDSLALLRVTGRYAPDTDESFALVTEIRDAVHDIPEADALVGGAVATDLDARDGNERDLLVVAPLILALSLIVLVLLLRAVVAPLILLAVNVASAAAAIGAGAWLSRLVFGQDAFAVQIPLLAFLFLVALGIDYTIFLVHRARGEAREHGTREGMVQAVTHTGSVITSAGIVLAGVFAALGVLPLVVLGQLGLIVGVGVLVDTLVVRTVIIPALFAVVGEAMWWPGRITRGSGGRSGETEGAGTTHDEAEQSPISAP